MEVYSLLDNWNNDDTTNSLDLARIKLIKYNKGCWTYTHQEKDNRRTSLNYSSNNLAHKKDGMIQN